MYEKKVYSLLIPAGANSQLKVDLARINKQHKATSQKCHSTLGHLRTQISQGRVDLAETRKALLKQLEDEAALAGKDKDEEEKNSGGDRKAA